MDSLRPKQARPAHGQPDTDEVLPHLSANPNPSAPGPVRPTGIVHVGRQDVSAAPGPSREESRSPLWMRRLSLVVFVTFCVELGLLLAILPWTRLWSENGLLLEHPMIREILQHNFMRGAVSGLGLVDAWLGIWEAVRYREAKV